MIGKLMKNNSFRATTRYVLEKEEARLLAGSSLAGTNTATIAREFQMSRSLNPEIEKPVYHLVQSYSHADRDRQNLDDDKLSDLARRHFAGLVVAAHDPEVLKEKGRSTYQSQVEKFLDKGICEYQFFIAKHEDTDHTHTHLVASRINVRDGHCIPTYKDYYRSQVVCRELEKDFGLEQLPSTGEVDRRSPSRRQQEKEKQTKIAPVLTKLQDAISQIAQAQRGSSLDEFIEALRHEGIETRRTDRIVKKEPRICLSYAMDGVAISGFKLGQSFTYLGLKQQFGIDADIAAEPEPTLPLTQEKTPISSSASALPEIVGQPIEPAAIAPTESALPIAQPIAPLIEPELITQPIDPESTAQPIETASASQVIDPSPAAQKILQFERDRLKQSRHKGRKNQRVQTPDERYSIDWDAQAKRLTITRNTGEIMLEATRTQSRRWNVTIDQVQPQDERHFNRYHQQRQEQQAIGGIGD